MAGETLDIDDIIVRDSIATEISNQYFQWDRARQVWKDEKVEVRKYVYATDTSTSSNNENPWHNSTHIPKLCQIRDNLLANYMASMFPRRKWLIWEGDNEKDASIEKTEAIRDYMSWVISQKEFKDVLQKLVQDFVDYGNAFGTVEWIDETTTDVDGTIKPGYVGPRAVRINPLDIVLNPIAANASQSPKIIRTLWTMGEAKQIIDQATTTPEEEEIAKEVWAYMKDVRHRSTTYGGDFKELDEYLHVDGFGSFREYLGSNYVELLSFYGDFYDVEKDVLLKNQFIVVIDRHKVILNKQHPTRTGKIPIYHSGWRVRQDNVWAMGPLDNLVGMQYRINHVENLKADLFDLTVFPPLKIKGLVEDFEWGPFERIYIDADGDVELMSPKAEILTANMEIAAYEQRMEEMAGSPKEAMGFRTPGEKTAYEVQRLENAASRIFQSKITQFEEQIIEPLLNAMLALARDNLTSATIRVINDDFKSVSFRDLTREDLSALGTLKPIAARHFAERAELVQNLNNFFASPLGQDELMKAHFSTVKMAEMFEELLELGDYMVVQPYVRLAEEADAQRFRNSNEEQVLSEIETPSGLSEDDFDDDDDFIIEEEDEENQS